MQKNYLQLKFVDSCGIMWITNLIGGFCYERKEALETSDIYWSIE